MKTKYRVAVTGSSAYNDNIGTATTQRGARRTAKLWAQSNAVSTHWLKIHMIPLDGSMPPVEFKY